MYELVLIGKRSSLHCGITVCKLPIETPSRKRESVVMKYEIVYFIVISIIGICNKAEGKTTLDIPESGNCGDDAVLTCNYSEPFRESRWYYSDTTFLINGSLEKTGISSSKYSEERGKSSFTLTIHDINTTDGRSYQCSNHADRSHYKSLHIECKATSAYPYVTRRKKLAFSVDKLYPASPIFRTIISIQNTMVTTIPGTVTCSNSTKSPSYFNCSWESKHSLGDGLYTYNLVVTTITQSDPLTGKLRIGTPNAPVIANTVNVGGKSAVLYKTDQTLTLECTSRGGYPEPTVDLYDDNVPSLNVTTSRRLQSDGTYTVTKRRTLVATSDYEGSTITCISHYPEADDHFRSLKQTNITLIPLFRIESFQIKGFEGQSNVTIDEDDPGFLFECDTGTFQSSDIRIRYNNEEVKTELTNVTSLTLLYNHSCFDTGKYTCEASNGHGQNSSVDVWLFVTCSPRPLLQMQGAVTSRLHVSASLVFHAVGFPELIFDWQKEVKRKWMSLSNSNHVTITSSKLDSNLTVHDVSKEDFGIYRLTVTNSVGSYQQYMYLTEEDTDSHKEDASPNEIVLFIGLICVGLALLGTLLTILFIRKHRNNGAQSSTDDSKERIYSNPVFEYDDSIRQQQQQQQQQQQKQKQKQQQQQQQQQQPVEYDDVEIRESTQTYTGLMPYSDGMGIYDVIKHDT